MVFGSIASVQQTNMGQFLLFLQLFDWFAETCEDSLIPVYKFQSLVYAGQIKLVGMVTTQGMF